MNQCMQCGHPARPEDVYCEECGFQLHPNQSQQDERKKSRFQLPAGLGSWKTLRWLIGIGAVALLSLGGLCGISGVLFVHRARGPQVYVTEVIRERVVTATATLTPTNTPGPSPTPTATSTPTQTSTPTPTPTPIPTTVPGSVLQPGEVWQSDGIAVWMDVVAINPSSLSVDMVVENTSKERLLIELGDIRMTTNTGGSSILHAGQLPRGVALEQGERFVITEGGFFPMDLFKGDVTEVFVEIIDMTRIRKASWRVEIPH